MSEIEAAVFGRFLPIKCPDEKVNIVDDTNIYKYFFEYFYLQILVAQPVLSVFLEKDVVLTQFVVHIFIHYVLDMLYKRIFGGVRITNIYSKLLYL